MKTVNRRRILGKRILLVMLSIIALSSMMSGAVLGASPEKNTYFVCPSVSLNNQNGMWVLGGHAAYFVIVPSKGGQLVRGAGMAAVVQGKEEDYILVKLPSGEIRRFVKGAYATIGKVGRGEYRTINWGKAGRTRRMGIRPSVRGVAQHPGAHPHGGGEGRSGIGLKYPKTVYGKKAVGKTRTRRKYSDHLIVQPRKKGPHVG